MNLTALALIGFIVWIILLILAIGGLRIQAKVKGKAPKYFRPDGGDVSPLAERLARAHANCYESFPFFGGVLLVALASQQTAITDPLAMIMLVARVAQSLVHISSTSQGVVYLRFALFMVQLLPALYACFALAQAFMAG
jgi:uncharacterized MAPEG superfamily protein